MMELRRFRSLPTGVPEPLSEFVADLVARSELLLRYGAPEAATAVNAVREDLEEVLNVWLDETLSTSEVAAMLSRSEETVRRHVRDGKLLDRRPDRSGPHMIRRGDVLIFDSHLGGSYDPDTDAQDIATRRRLK